MEPKLRVWNGPNLLTLTEAELAKMLDDPRATWGNVEISVEHGDAYASVGWTGFLPESDAIGSGFLVRIDGMSPLGEESPEVRPVLDGAGAPTQVASRHLVCASAALHVLACFGRSGARANRSRDGVPIAWGPAVVSTSAWDEVGRVEPLDDQALYVDDLVSLVYWTPPAPEGTDADAGEELPDGELPWLGQVGILLEHRALTDREAIELPATALWPVVRALHDVSDPRWLALIAEHPMPWLRSLMVTTDALEGLVPAVRALPRLVELAVHGRCEELAPLEAPRLESLVLDVRSAATAGRLLRESQLPSLRTLVLHEDALDAPIDLSRLHDHAVVMVDLGASADPRVLRNAATAPVLAIDPPKAMAAALVVDALTARAEGDNVVSSAWPHASEAIALARGRGIRLRAQ